MAVHKSMYFITLITILSLNCNSMKNIQKPQKNLVLLRNNNIELGVSLALGGNVMILKLHNHNSIIKSDTITVPVTLSNDPLENAKLDFIEYNGQTVWIGPQSEWWTQQDLHKERKDSKAVWPPDPYIMYGKYKIISQTDTSLIIEGPVSPISGLQMTKEITLIGNKVRFKVVAQNKSNRNVSWDLWFNMRLNGMARAYIPVNKESITSIKPRIDKTSDSVDYKITDDLFTYIPTKPVSVESRNSKAFIYPLESTIYAFDESQALVIRFERHPKESIHPDQALVEIFNHINKNSNADLLELEHHAPYLQLAPQQKMEAWEEWELFEYSGVNNTEAHTAFIKNIPLK